jgi:hypothetical protein
MRDKFLRGLSGLQARDLGFKHILENHLKKFVKNLKLKKLFVYIQKIQIFL